MVFMRMAYIDNSNSSTHPMKIFRNCYFQKFYK
uniref:Uncharacterized protein n=1 Tax=Arundo donax TaxID=35708 RepID=A0A0A9FRP4_ARUDO